LFSFLVGWHAGAVSLPPDDAIFAQLANPLNDAILFTPAATNLSF